MGGENLTGGVVLKAEQRELRAATFQPVVTAGVGEHHHARARTARAAGAIFTRTPFLRRSQAGAAQQAAHRLAADREAFLGIEFLGQMRIVEPGILATGQLQNQNLRGRRQGPRHRASAIAVLHPGDGIGLITALEPLHLTFAELPHTGGFAYTHPAAGCILNHFHSLELFLTHRHHP